MQNRLKDLREDRDLSQKELAEKLGYHVTTYARWEQKTHQIKLCDAIVIADFFGVSLDYLAGKTDDPKRYYQ
ncbi:MAG: helix-turn-helix transcriptional regulator [Clostridia bacterium]|nr:helix-turn-helix transcriptional regulator [Clostridia bacterium]